MKADHRDLHLVERSVKRLASHDTYETSDPDEYMTG